MAVEPKDIATLWLQENAVVNQKTAYYFASVAILAWPVVYAAHNGLLVVGFLLALLGALFSAMSFFSIARTAAYRDHWRRELTSASADYADMFSRISFKWYEGLRSNSVLISLPVLGLIIWVLVATYFALALS